jgi:hypothetical protein
MRLEIHREEFEKKNSPIRHQLSPKNLEFAGQKLWKELCSVADKLDL